MKLRCTQCDLTFEVEDEERCPKCLRKSTVVDPDAPGAAGAAGRHPHFPGDPARGHRGLGGFVIRFVSGGAMIGAMTAFGTLQLPAMGFGWVLFAAVVGGLTTAGLYSLVNNFMSED